ncbi:hypothetical protein ZOSMA_241G00450 [Zostera marina]|uniref:Uncharacterized protein n=1 Tax=Zostera marina TaxID=29655 RepID=A0A0K9PGY9_ZOSMR|nr:hypothetical protein ZOSMA_241G00450 [Zostera marina]
MGSARASIGHRRSVRDGIGGQFARASIGHRRSVREGIGGQFARASIGHRRSVQYSDSENDDDIYDDSRASFVSAVATPSLLRKIFGDDVILRQLQLQHGDSNSWNDCSSGMASWVSGTIAVPEWRVGFLERLQFRNGELGSWNDCSSETELIETELERLQYVRTDCSIGAWDDGRLAIGGCRGKVPHIGLLRTGIENAVTGNPDVLVLRNIDFMFRLPQLSARGNDGDLFTSGVMVIEPSECSFQTMMDQQMEIVSYAMKHVRQIDDDGTAMKHDRCSGRESQCRTRCSGHRMGSRSGVRMERHVRSRCFSYIYIYIYIYQTLYH